MRSEPDGDNAVTPLSSKERNGKAFVVVFAALAAGVALYFALGMPGMDHGTASSMPAMDMSASAGSHRRVGPAEFERLLADRSATVINVHTPYAGKIDGTDLFLQFDNLDRSQLPADHATPLLVYCRSGYMSTIASSTLVQWGYTNVVELDGGMQAWTRSGRPLIDDD